MWLVRVGARWSGLSHERRLPPHAQPNRALRGPPRGFAAVSSPRGRAKIVIVIVNTWFGIIIIVLVKSGIISTRRVSRPSFVVRCWVPSSAAPTRPICKRYFVTRTFMRGGCRDSVASRVARAVLQRFCHNGVHALLHLSTSTCSILLFLSLDTLEQSKP